MLFWVLLYFGQVLSTALFVGKYTHTHTHYTLVSGRETLQKQAGFDKIKVSPRLEA